MVALGNTLKQVHVNLFDVHVFLEMEGKNRGPFIHNPHNSPVES